MSSGSPEFDRLKQHLEANPKVRTEVEFAFSSLLAKANPSDRGLRFLFGNGAEWIMAAAAWSAGVLTAPSGHNANGFDLTDLMEQNRSLWSVKASASNKASQIRLINFMGSGTNAVWNEPTLFVSPYLGGAVLIDPSQDTAMADEARRSADALILPGAVPKRYAEAHPANFIAFEVAINEGASSNDQYAFIKSVIEPAHFPNLSRPFVESEPPARSGIAEEIVKLSALRDSGMLTTEQFGKAVDRLVSH